MKSPEEITAAIWRLIDVTAFAETNSRKELVKGLYEISMATLEALAVAEEMAPEEMISLCQSSQSWPHLVCRTNNSEAKRRLAMIRAHLGRDTGFDGKPAQVQGTNAAFALRAYCKLEPERRRHLWEYLSDHAKAEFARTARTDETPEECHAAFKATNYPEWERYPQDCEGGEINPITGEVFPDMARIDLRWTYAAGLLGPLTQDNTDEWAEAATLYFEALSPEGDLMSCPLVPSVVIDPKGLREANRSSNKNARRAAEDSARKNTRTELKKKLKKGFDAIVWKS